VTPQSIVLAVRAVAPQGADPTGRIKWLLRLPHVRAAVSACVAGCTVFAVFTATMGRGIF
jgi:hypothetical protein